jgi:GGDEF domain-containing protein
VGSLDLRRIGVPGVSVSVGVAVADSPDMDLGVVIDDADRALYRAKRAGRDRVVAA